jgi:hypothetical protein
LFFWVLGLNIGNQMYCFLMLHKAIKYIIQTETVSQRKTLALMEGKSPDIRKHGFSRSFSYSGIGMTAGNSS